MSATSRSKSKIVSLDYEFHAPMGGIRSEPQRWAASDVNNALNSWSEADLMKMLRNDPPVAAKKLCTPISDIFQMAVYNRSLHILKQLDHMNYLPEYLTPKPITPLCSQTPNTASSSNPLFQSLQSLTETWCSEIEEATQNDQLLPTSRLEKIIEILVFLQRVADKYALVIDPAGLDELNTRLTLINTASSVPKELSEPLSALLKEFSDSNPSPLS